MNLPEIFIPRPTREIVASKAGVILNGSLSSTEGTDCTKELQKIIDEYTPHTNLRLIIDGVALVHSLKLRSNMHVQGYGMTRQTPRYAKLRRTVRSAR